MGLQTWPPSKPPLSSMACLDVETPSICRGKFKSVLQLCLQQRRTREQLVEQGIMPPLKSPSAFHEQIRNLERARTGNFLKHKLCSRPQRSELVRMHILRETQVEPSLQATQMKLKRARLADDLKEKLAQRPGPMELVEKKILAVDSNVEELVKGGKADGSQTPPVSDVYNFDENSSDVLSPQQPSSQQPNGSTLTSPPESGGSEATCTSSTLNTSTQHSSTLSSQSTSDAVHPACTTEQQSNQQTRQPNTPAAPSNSSGPVLVKQSLAKLPADKSRSKKTKEPKPRVKKLKYHQYIPPDQKQELSEIPMEASYARLLQQQQQFLQLQILSQQQQQFSYPGVRPAAHKSTSEAQTSCLAVVPRGTALSAAVQLHQAKTSRKPDQLPANLDEMKVAELKMELKLRSLPVSGTKTDLIERLKLFQENSTIHSGIAMETAATTASSQSENTKLTPPVSVIASKVSSLGIEDINMTDNAATLLSDSPNHASPYMSPAQGAQQEECSTEKTSIKKDSEKDKRLHEKERQIEELMRKLEQEQRLVEELKMQLEVEKRSQQADSPSQLSPSAPTHVKEENRTPSTCSMSRRSPGLPVLVKQEESADQNHTTSTNQLIIGHQTITQPEALPSAQAGAQIILPASLPTSAVTVEFPAKSIELHTAVSSAAPGLIQTSGQAPQKIEASAALQQQRSAQTQQLTKSFSQQTWSADTKTQTLFNTFPVRGCAVAPCTQAAQTGPGEKQPKFTNHMSKSKDPPPYEDAVKQTRNMLTTVQGPTAASQHMDDLFDVLIESGEISPFIRHDSPSLDKPLPVTASVTTLPINTVLSRPPPLVQVAQLPTAPHGSSAGLAALTSDIQMETFMDALIVTDMEPQKLKLMEELNSPEVTMEVDFIENTPSCAPNLQNTSMDNMDWLDLTLAVPPEGVNPLDVPVGVFSSDFLDSHELHLNWD
ncbi:myocardin-related transcription factor B [Cololabis saira]|uniref:myocardin-related transcription factor B n=1 Tax=Cololabis saira TaxID=129043 RepID=UPI002AD3202E|nr:myocardin-related transcription factor B [Cololabis saira]